MQTASAGSKQHLRLWIRLLRSTRFVEAELRERLRREFDCTLPRFDVLAALYRFDRAITMTELSRFLMVSNGNVTGIVERLVADGLVSRAANARDRRTSYVRLTKKGRTAFAEMARAHEAWVAELLASVSPGETAELIALLARVKDAVMKEGAVP